MENIEWRSCTVQDSTAGGETAKLFVRCVALGICLMIDRAIYVHQALAAAPTSASGAPGSRSAAPGRVPCLNTVCLVFFGGATAGFCKGIICECNELALLRERSNTTFGAAGPRGPRVLLACTGGLHYNPIENSRNHRNCKITVGFTVFFAFRLRCNRQMTVLQRFRNYVTVDPL